MVSSSSESDSDESSDYKTPVLDLSNGKQLFLFRVPKGIDVSAFDGATLKVPSEKKEAKSLNESTVYNMGNVSHDEGNFSFELGSCVENETMRSVFSDKQGKLRVAPTFHRQINIRREVNTEDVPSNDFDILTIPGGQRAYTPRVQPEGLRVRFTPAGAAVPAQVPATTEKKHVTSPSPQKDKKKRDKSELKSSKKKKRNE